MNIRKSIVLCLFILSVGFAQAQSKAKAERPYIIHERGQHMTKLSIIKDLRGIGNTIQIDALNLSGGTLRIVGEQKTGVNYQIGHTEEMPGADITEVTAFLGSYNALREVSKSGRGETIQLTQVVFPVKLRITISQQVLEVEIKEEGYWKISVGMSK